jgi:PAS domain S-box-containing protein
MTQRARKRKAKAAIKPAPRPRSRSRRKDGPAVGGQSESARLQAALRAARKELRSTVAELQAANQHLRASNDSLTAINNELRLANAEARKSEAVLLGILNATQESIWLFSAEGQVLLGNQTALARWGRPADDIIGKPMLEVLPGELGKARLARTRETVETRGPVAFEDEREGISFEHRFFPVFGHDGQVERVAAFSRDVSARKRDEERLRRYQLLADHSRDIVLFVRRDDLRILEANAAAVATYGYSRDELLALTLRDLRVPEAPSVADEQLDDADRRGSLFETQHRRRDGSRFPVEVSSRGVTLGGVRTLINVVRDIGERKRVQDERERLFDDLQRRTAELDATLASMADGVVIYGPDGQLRFANQTAVEILRQTPEEQAETDLEKRAKRMSYLKEDGTPYALAETPVAKAFRGVSSKRVVVRLPRLDNEIWISVSASPIRTPAGTLLGVVSSLRDITQSRQLDARVAWLASFPERNPLPIMETDLAGRICYINQSARRLLPDLEDKGLAHPWLADWQDVVASLRSAPAQTRERIVRVGDLSYHQSLHWVSDLGRIRIYGRDTTASTRMQQELHEANQRLREADLHKNEFLAVLSHELRNPLTPIRNSLVLLTRSRLESESAQRAVAIIGRQTEHMIRLVDDLLDLTRISRGKIRLQSNLLDLGELVRRSVDDLRSLFADGGIDLQVSTPGHAVPVDGDATRLAQTVGNLLHNALKFTPPGGHVRASLVESDGRAVLSVRDDGVGLGHEIQAQLFEPFSQADTTLNRSRGGLGLGLALVKGMVDLHGGRVSASSEGPGQGSEFTVELPLARSVEADLPGPEPSQSRATSSARPFAASARRRVLVIEDNLDAATSLCEVLAFGSHEVALAHNGVDGLARAHAFKPDVVLCDIGLPGMDGYQVARAFRAEAELRHAFLVALTGYALPEDLKRAQDAGFDRHLAKPPSLEALEEVLGKIG